MNNQVVKNLSETVAVLKDSLLGKLLIWQIIRRGKNENRMENKVT